MRTEVSAADGKYITSRPLMGMGPKLREFQKELQKPNQVNCNKPQLPFLVSNSISGIDEYFDALDLDGSFEIDANEYEEAYIKLKEKELGRPLTGDDAKLYQYRKEAKNLFSAVAEKRQIGQDIDGKPIYTAGISKSRLYAMQSVFSKEASNILGQRFDIVKKEGPMADVFNGRTFGMLIDREQSKLRKAKLNPKDVRPGGAVSISAKKSDKKEIIDALIIPKNDNMDY